MRRLIAYITMAISMLIAIGVAATPVLTKLNGGREYNSGREIVFNLNSREDKEVTQEDADKVVEEMRTRLDNWHIEDYSIRVQNTTGEDKSYSVAVSFNVEKDTFNYVAKYLCFDGGNVSVSGDKPETLKENVFKLDEARIVYESDVVPVVVIPVSDTGKADLEKLIEEVSPKTENAEGGQTANVMKRAMHANMLGDEVPPTEGGEETAQPDIFLWTNYEEGDSVDKEAVNPLVKDKILMRFLSSNIWYQKAKEEHTEVQFICGSADSEGNYDFTKLKDANVVANYYLNMLKASKYDVEVTCPTRNVTETEIDYYTNALEVNPTFESLLSLGNNVNIRLSTTLIASLIAMVIISLLLVVYYRINAIAMIVTTIGSLFITLLSFSSMNVVFNFPAVLGLIILVAGVLFGQIIYCNKFKEEVYKGRSLKKANQEASKRSNLLSLDSAIITAFAGLMMYALGGTALKPMGVILFFGAVFGLLMNLIVFKILMKLVTNSTNLQNKYKVFNIEASKVPNLMNAEEKESYESPYEKVDFTKRRKISAIILGALTVAAVVVITVFGVKNGSPLNVSNSTKNSTVIYTTMKVDNNLISDVETYKQYALKDVKSDENTKVSADKFEVEMKKVQTYTYDETSPEKTEELYFICKIAADYNADQISNIEQSITASLEEAIPSKYEMKVETSKELNYTPDQRYVALATAITIIGASVYVALRFRPSRGVAALVVSSGSTAIAYGLFVAIRVGTSAVTSLAMPLVAVTTLITSLFFFAQEKSMVKEKHGDLSFEERKEIMVKALSKAAAPMLVLVLLTIYLSINFFGFGLSETAFLFASALVGQIVAVVAILTVMGPLACAVGKVFGKIHLRKPKMFQHKENVPHKRNSSEPEETIFIGIND
ncbi:MAG: hypothetical protein KBS97_00390 [Firmicutes bacterium]|nr:hypothetical protein [Candidatus Fiminaster equi]